MLDLVSAKCRYAMQRGCVCPQLDDNGRMELREARHPLLVELFARQTEQEGVARQVVPIDARLGDDFDVLMVTGPNTGGKTVALKTIGLCVLMTQAGIPIPAAEGSRLPVYRQVFVDIGDEQSLQQSLSTFSGHMQNLLSILQRSGARSLVLIDELGAGTDPDEGAAIGSAVVDELLERGARAVITTHLSALKALAFTQKRVDNASVEFDVQTLQPMYHLRIGEPGNSNAIIIAERLGMPQRMAARARAHLAGRGRILREAIEGTLESRREAERARKAAQQAQMEATRTQEQLEQQAQRLRDAQGEFAEWTQWVNALQPGDEVLVRSMKQLGRVVRMQLHRQRVLVSVGSLHVEVALMDVSQPAGGNDRPAHGNRG